jgi:hypothetical protein
MKWVEVIKLRSAKIGAGLREELLLPAEKPGLNGPVEMKAYRHAALDTDWSVHLHWESERPEQNGSALGMRLARAMKEYGLVDHSVWIEEGD